MRIFVCFALLLSTLAAGQVAPPTDPCLERTIAVGLMPRDVVKSVRFDLANTKFQATLAKEAVPVESVRKGGAPHHFLLLVDTSGSMGPETQVPSKIQAAFRLAADAVRRLPDTTSIAVMLFGPREETMGFGTSRDEIVRRLNLDPRSANKTAQGKTPLLDAILDALRLIPSPEPGDVIYAITDGGDNSSKARQVEVRKALQGAGVRLFAFVLASAAGPPVEEELEGPGRMKELADATAGLAATFPGQPVSPIARSYALGDPAHPQVEVALRLLFQQITAPLILQVRLPRAPDKFRDFKVELLDERGRPRRDIVLSYPRQLAPCPRN